MHKTPKTKSPDGFLTVMRHFYLEMVLQNKNPQDSQEIREKTLSIITSSFVFVESIKQLLECVWLICLEVIFVNIDKVVGDIGLGVVDVLAPLG